MPAGPAAMMDGRVVGPLFPRSRGGMRKALLLFALLAAACGGDDDGVSNGLGGSTVVGTPECTAFCMNISDICGPGAHCDDQFFCEIRQGECAASTRARLACSAMNRPTCFDGGWAIGGCPADDKLCSSDGGG